MTEPIEWDDQLCRRYAEGARKLARYDARGVASRIAKHLGGLRAGAAVVDLASGPGFLAFELARVIRQPKLTLVDSAAPMLRIALEEAERAGLSVRTLENSAQSVALPDGFAEVVTCKNLLNCIDADHRALVAREAFRLLAPGGKAFIVDFDVHGSRLAAAFIAAFVHCVAGKEFQRDFRQAVARRFEPAPLADALAAAGAQVAVERFGPTFLLVARRHRRSER